MPTSCPRAGEHQEKKEDQFTHIHVFIQPEDSHEQNLAAHISLSGFHLSGEDCLKDTSSRWVEPASRGWGLSGWGGANLGQSVLEGGVSNHIGLRPSKVRCGLSQGGGAYFKGAGAAQT